MWLSQKQKEPDRGRGAAQVGPVTVPGSPVSVWMDGERRSLPLFGPGGYCWVPEREQQVLVIQTGAEGEAPCVAGTRMADQQALRPGEIWIGTPDGKASIRLERDGVIRMEGLVLVNGEQVGGMPDKEGKTVGTGGA